VAQGCSLFRRDPAVFITGTGSNPLPQIALARRLSASRDSTAQFGALSQLRLVPAVAPHEQSNGGRYLAIETSTPAEPPDS
jgi:hypothetical protein